MVSILFTKHSSEDFQKSKWLEIDKDQSRAQVCLKWAADKLLVIKKDVFK